MLSDLTGIISLFLRHRIRCWVALGFDEDSIINEFIASPLKSSMIGETNRLIIRVWRDFSIATYKFQNIVQSYDVLSSQRNISGDDYHLKPVLLFSEQVRDLIVQ